jgi:hypothetical protein
VHNQPLEQLFFNVPDGWALVDDQLELSSSTAAASKEPAPIEPPRRETFAVAAASDSVLVDGAQQLRVPLPQPRLGIFQVRLRMERAWPDGQLVPAAMQLHVPLPIDGDITSHRLSITSDRQLDVTLDESMASTTWRSIAGVSRAHPDAPLELVANDRDAALSLVIRRVDPHRPQATTIERIWLQTWQAGSVIQERAAFRFRTLGKTAMVELPPGVSAEEVEVLIDGLLADVSSREEGRLAVKLPRPPEADQDKPIDAHTLEIRYRRSGSTNWISHHQLTPPQLVGTSTLGAVYWQLVVPSGVHVIRPPDQLAAVDRWEWSNMFWRRQAALGQEELAKWVGATIDQSAPAASGSQYVFSGFAPVASIDLITAPRWLIVLATSGLVLAVAGLWLYVPAVGRGWIAVGVAAVVAVLAFSFPVQAALLGQASIVGWLLVVVSVALRSWLTRPVTRQPLTAGSTQLRLRPPSRSDSYPTQLAGSSVSGTPATSATVPDSDR